MSAEESTTTASMPPVLAAAVLASSLPAVRDCHYLCAVESRRQGARQAGSSPSVKAGERERERKKKEATNAGAMSRVEEKLGGKKLSHLQLFFSPPPCVLHLGLSCILNCIFMNVARIALRSASRVGELKIWNWGLAIERGKRERFRSHSFFLELLFFSPRSACFRFFALRLFLLLFQHTAKRSHFPFSFFFFLLAQPRAGLLSPPRSRRRRRCAAALAAAAPAAPSARPAERTPTGGPSPPSRRRRFLVAGSPPLPPLLPPPQPLPRWSPPPLPSPSSARTTSLFRTRSSR